MNNASIISLSVFDLSLAAGLVIALALLTWRMRLGVTQQLLIAALRTVIQLGLLGLVLQLLFDDLHPLWLIPIALIMLFAAGREVNARQKHPLRGWRGFSLGTLAMFLSSFSVALFALTILIQNTPWYTPQYAIPLLGMLLGNTMTGVAVGLDRLTSRVREQREMIEQRLMLGETAKQAMQPILSDSTRSGLIPIINAMAAAGLVSLPGMMTGQILAGIAPLEAVKYQILIMFLITAGTGLGILIALRIASRQLFDQRQRLRLERLKT